VERIARSYLFVPGNRPDRFSKAVASGAHAVIIDLEDAVPAVEKASARDSVAAWLRAAQPVVIRINGVETEWFREDMTVCRMPGVRAILLPKTQGVEHLRRVEALLGDRMPILPLIETAEGFSNALEIARHPAVERLAFGDIDFRLDLGIQGNGEELYSSDPNWCWCRGWPQFSLRSTG
jgi:citrate lyase subunit beta/citryl-CoA lyase